jgi:hypothetical protein
MAGLAETLIIIEHFEDGKEEVRKEELGPGTHEEPSTPSLRAQAASGVKKVENRNRES